MSLFRKHTVLISSLLILAIAVVFAIPQTQKQQELRQHAQTNGTQLYAAPNGSGNCTQASPCSLSQANSQATPGTTIIAAPGTYNGPFVTTKGGSAGNFITFRSQTKHGATITSNGEGSSMSVVEVKHEYVRFQDFTITGAQARHGFHLDANNVEIIGNHIHTLVQWQTGNTGWKGGAGVQTGSSQMSGLVIDGNEIDHIGAPGSTEQLVHGMYIDAHVTNSRVSNNVIHDVEDFALHPYPESEASGWVFVNNTIINTGRGILQAPNGVTRNNIVYNTRGTQYDIRGSGNVVSNNIGGGTGSGSENGVTNADPMFVNPASDWHLKPGSPAIDKGSTDGAPQTDIEGKIRPQGAGVDIGAYEVGDATTNPSPSTVPSPSVPFGGIAPCPGNPGCPSPEPSAPISGSPNPSGGVPNNPSVTVPEPTVDPCLAGASLAHGDKKKSKHWEPKGGVSGLMEALLRFFIELLNLLLRLIGGGQLPPLNPSEPTPSTQPEPTAGQPQPTVDPCEPAQPTNAPSSIAPSIATPSIQPSTPAATTQLPAQILNLSNWKLQLPIGDEESPDEIKQPQLATYTIAPWFISQGNGVRFRAPVNGVTTSGSNYPRSELREMTNNGATNASWSTATGTHTMTIDEAITAVPTTKKHVVAGQIHDGNKDVIVVRLEMPKLYINISGQQGPTLDANYTLGKRFTVKFEAVNNQINMYYNGSTTPVYTMNKSVPTAYFKAGAYTQSNCTTETAGPCSADNYGEVVIYNVAVTHQ